MSLYRKILIKSWKTTWENKYLWFFGLFAGLITGGNYKIILNTLSGDMDKTVFPGLRRMSETGIFSASVFSNIANIAKDDPVSLIVIMFVIIALLALTAFLIWLSVISQVSLVNNSAGYLTGKKNNFSSGVASGMNNFWPVFSLNIFIKLIIYVAFIIIFLPLLLTSYQVGYMVSSLYLLAFVIFLPVSIIASFIIKYAIAYVVLKKNSFKESIRDGWKLFINNWLISIEMAFVLFFIEFLVGISAILVILILAVPLLFLAYAFYQFISLAAFYLIAILAFVLFLVIVILMASVMATFQISSWTGLFVELTSKGGTSKIVRVVDSIIKRKK